MRSTFAWALVALLALGSSALADQASDTWLAAVGAGRDDAARSGAPEGSWLAAADKAAAESDVKADKAAAPKGDGPPLPLHTMEGVGGALTVPMAYLVNPGPKGTIIGKPAVSATFLGLSTKNLTVFSVTETLFRRIELGYAVGRFDIGNLGHVAKKVTGGLVSLSRRDIWLHQFNARALLIEENTKCFGIPLPSVVAGIQVKYNADIQHLNDDTKVLFPDGAFDRIGLERSNGIDYVLTVSKMFPQLLFGRPLILTAGVRNSNASNFGYTGFGGKCHTTLEADAVTLITDWFAVGYEFRQRSDPYDKFKPLHKGESNLHAIRAAIILSDQLTLAGGWACMGNVANDRVDCAWGIQVKYEF
jgi:hypothetical protein